MAFLDDIDKKLTNLGQGAIQKTKEVTDSAKLSSSIKNLEGQKKEAMAELGAISYRKWRESGENAGPEEAGVIARIDEMERQLSDLRGQLQRVKGVIFCPNCHAQISPDSAFCNVCGAKIEHPAPAPAPAAAPQNQNVCRYCGAPLEPDQLFCVNCGKKIEKEEPAPGPQTAPEPTPAPEPKPAPEPIPAPEPQPAPEPIPQPIPEPIPAPQPQPAPQGATCPNCGAEVGAGQGFCIMCGTPLKKDQPSGGPAVDSSQPPHTKICPNCGKVLADHLSFCTSCGTKLN